MTATPQPVPGLVIRYSYLWRREYLEGREEGLKDRPCAIVAAIRVDGGETRVVVLPVTHTPPSDPAQAVELPPKVKRRLNLDDGRSWVVLTEWNEFAWPGPDLRPATPTGSSMVYGVLPPRLFATIRDGFLTLARAGSAAPVRRTT